MISFKDYLIESFDTKPVPFRQTRNDQFRAVYEFKINDIVYEVDFLMRNRGADVVFTAKADAPNAMSTLNLTGTGNQFKVLITVIAIIKQFIIESAAPVLTFSAAKNEIVGDARPKVYRRLIQRELSKLPGNWSVKEKEVGNKVKFALLNNDEI